MENRDGSVTQREQRRWFGGTGCDHSRASRSRGVRVEVCAWEMGWAGMDEKTGAASAGQQGATALSIVWKRKPGAGLVLTRSLSSCYLSTALYRVAAGSSQDERRGCMPARANNSMYRKYWQQIRRMDASNGPGGGRPVLVNASGGDVPGVLCSAQRATRPSRSSRNKATGPGSQKRGDGER